MRKWPMWMLVFSSLTGTLPASDFFLPHMAAGSGVRTAVILFNPYPQPVQLQIDFTTDDGTPFPVELLDLGVASHFNLTLKAGQRRTLETAGSQTVRTGAVHIQSDHELGVSSVFSILDSEGRLLTEAGIAATEPVSTFVIPVDGSGAFKTGLALFNPSETAATIQFRLLDHRGSEVAQTPTPLELGPHGHWARFILGQNELFPPRDGFRGSVEVVSSLPLAALTLRQHSGPLTFTTLPTVSTDSKTRSALLPHLANGTYSGGIFRSTFVLVNSANVAASVQISAHQDDGTPLTLSIPSLGSSDTFPLTLEAGATRFLQTDGTGALFTGAARVESNVPIGVSAIFTIFDPADHFVTEAGVADSPSLEQFTVPVSVSPSFNSGLALFNPGATSATLSLRLLDDQGQTQAVANPIKLAPQAHTARLVSELFPGHQPFEGAVAVASTAAVAPLTLRVNQSPLGYTTLPVAGAALDRTTVVQGPIGPAGGTLASSLASIQVPAGAFEGVVDLSISISGLYRPLGDLGGSTFLIDGLPETIHQPLTIRLRQSDPPPADSRLFLGSEKFVSSQDDNSTELEPVPFSYSDGFLQVELPPFEAPQPSAAGTETAETAPTDGGPRLSPRQGGTVRLVLVLGHGFLVYETAHFSIWTNANDGQSGAGVVELGSVLESAWNRYYSWGFRYDRLPPGRITIEAFRPLGQDGKYTNSLLSQYAGVIEINPSLLSDIGALRRTAAHEFFHLVQYLYDTRWAWSKAKLKPEHYWVNEATATWVEKFFALDPDAAPLTFDLIEPFKGMEASNTGPHGYGMAALFEDSWSGREVCNLYQALDAGTPHVTAMLNVKGGTLWWIRFWQHYLEGKIYGVRPDEFYNAVSRTLTAADQQPASSSFSTSMIDLSADLTRIHLSSDPRWPTRLFLQLSGARVHDSVGVDLFKFRPHLPDRRSDFIRYWDGSQYETRSQLFSRQEFNGLRQHYDDLYLLLQNAHATAPYTSRDAVQAQVDAESAENLGFVARLDRLRATYTSSKYGVGTPQTTNFVIGSAEPPDRSANQVDPLHFTTQWEISEGAGGNQGTFIATFDPVALTLDVSAYFKQYSGTQYTDPPPAGTDTDYVETSFILSGVPVSPDISTANGLFELWVPGGFLTGNGICAYIQDLKQKTVSWDVATKQNITTELTSYECQGESAIDYWGRIYWPNGEVE